MSKQYQLEAVTEKKERVVATFSAEKGFALTGLSVGEIDAIASIPFGCLIGPHFASRHPKTFPESERPPNLDSGPDPLFNGIARYAPWKVTANAKSLKASLHSDDQWGEKSLEEWEGQAFEMKFESKIWQSGIYLRLSVVSAADSLVGFEIRCPKQENMECVSAVSPSCIQEEGIAPVPESWFQSETGRMVAKMDQPCDLAFHPYPNPLQGKIDLRYSTHMLQIRYRCAHQENAWLLKNEKQKEYLSIIPVTSQNPWRPNLSVSALDLTLNIVAIS